MQAIKGGGMAEWFSSLDLKSGGPWFKSFSLPPSGSVLGSPEFKSSIAIQIPNWNKNPNWLLRVYDVFAIFVYVFSTTTLNTSYLFCLLTFNLTGNRNLSCGTIYMKRFSSKKCITKHWLNHDSRSLLISLKIMINASFVVKWKHFSFTWFR